jgi:hypothetical protein
MIVAVWDVTMLLTPMEHYTANLLIAIVTVVMQQLEIPHLHLSVSRVIHWAILANAS